MSVEKTQQVLELLKQYKQDHIINFMNTLNDEEKELLENQILSIDFNQLTELYDSTKRKCEIKESKIEAIQYFDKQKNAIG